MASSDPTYIGQVASVAGGIVRVRLRRDLPTTLVLVEGESYRVGQIGGFFGYPSATPSFTRSARKSALTQSPGIGGDAMQLERDNAKTKAWRAIDG